MFTELALLAGVVNLMQSAFFEGRHIMKFKSVLLGTALAMLLSAGSVQSAEKFATLGSVPVAKMTTAESAKVRGANHIPRFLDSLGLTSVTSGPAYGSMGQPGTARGLIQAGSGGFTGCGGCGNDISTILGLFQP